MEAKLKFVSKEEAHQLIDKAPGNTVLVLSYNSSIGFSDFGKYIKKKKGKKLVDKSVRVVLADSDPVLTLNLHDKIIGDFTCYNREEIIKSIMLAKL